MSALNELIERLIEREHGLPGYGMRRYGDPVPPVEEGGPGSGRKRTVWAKPEKQDEEGRMTSKFLMKPAERAKLIKVSPERAGVIKKAMGWSK